MVGVLCVYYDAYACRATTVRLKVTVNSFLDSTLVPKLNVCVLFRETVARFRSPSPRDRWRSRDRRDRRDRLAIVAIVGDRLAIEAILAIMETSGLALDCLGPGSLEVGSLGADCPGSNCLGPGTAIPLPCLVRTEFANSANN